jgi:hypothetical protein
MDKKPITIDTEPLKRFLNKQENLKSVELIYELYAYQKKLEETRNNPQIDIQVNNEDLKIPQSVVRKMRDQCILVLIDEIDIEFLNLKK